MLTPKVVMVLWWVYTNYNNTPVALFWVVAIYNSDFFTQHALKSSNIWLAIHVSNMMEICHLHAHSVTMTNLGTISQQQ